MQASSVVHVIEHDELSFRLAVESGCGKTQNQHLFIGARPRPPSRSAGYSLNSTAGESTLASMRWAANGRALILTSVDAATGDEMVVSRHLTAANNIMVQRYCARRASTGEIAEAMTIFRRMVRCAAPSTIAEE